MYGLTGGSLAFGVVLREPKKHIAKRAKLMFADSASMGLLAPTTSANRLSIVLLSSLVFAAHRRPLQIKKLLDQERQLTGWTVLVVCRAKLASRRTPCLRRVDRAGQSRRSGHAAWRNKCDVPLFSLARWPRRADRTPQTARASRVKSSVESTSTAAPLVMAS